MFFCNVKIIKLNMLGNFMKKLKVGLYSFTCCEGCTIVFIEALNKHFDSWTSQIEFVDMRVLKPYKGVNKTDVAFCEGAISTESEVRKLKEIRKKTKHLIAYGAGASIGFPSDQRNKFDATKLAAIADDIKRFKQIDKIRPLKDFVKVDDEILGCPVDMNVVIAKVEALLKSSGA